MRFGSKHNTSYISQCSNISTLCTFALPSQCAGAIGTPPAVVEMPIPEGCFSLLLMESISALFSIHLLKMTRSSSGLLTFSAFSNSLRAMSSCLSLVVLSKDNPTFLNDSLPLSLLARLMEETSAPSIHLQQNHLTQWSLTLFGLTSPWVALF